MAYKPSTEGPPGTKITILDEFLDSRAVKSVEQSAKRKECDIFLNDHARD